MLESGKKSILPIIMSGSEKESGPLPEKQSGGHFANGGAHEPELKGQRTKKIISSNANSRANSRENSVERSNKDPSPSAEQWECDTCRKTFVNKDDQLLSCEYCGNFRCIQCLGINKTVYQGISGRPDIPWFCSNCVVKSLESLRQTKTIEDRCKDFISEFQLQVEERMSKIEGEVLNMRSDIVNMKDDLVKEVKDSLKKDNETNPIDINNENNSATPSTPWVNEKVSTDSIVQKATSEMQARLARKDNIAFYNVREPTGNLKSETLQQDKDAVTEICDEMGVRVYDDNMLNIKRVGKKNQTRKVHGEEMVVPRILIVTFTESTKVKIMKSAYKLRESDSDYFKKIGLKHDMTREERAKDLELKKEARQLQEKQTEGEDFLYLVKGLPWERHIIKRKRKDNSGVEPQGVAL